MDTKRNGCRWVTDDTNSEWCVSEPHRVMSMLPSSTTGVGAAVPAAELAALVALGSSSQSLSVPLPSLLARRSRGKPGNGWSGIEAPGRVGAVEAGGEAVEDAGWAADGWLMAAGRSDRGLLSG